MILFHFSQLNHLAYQLLELPFLQDGQFSVLHHANNEAYVNVRLPVHGEHCVILGTIAPPDSNLINILLLAHTLKKEGSSRVSALLPYMAYTRHDKDKPGESLTTQAVGQLLKTSGFDEIWTLDVHSQRAQELLSVPLVSISPAPLFVRIIKDRKLQDATLVAPDNGAVLGCEEVQEALNMPGEIITFEKHRTESGITHEALKGHIKHTALIFDDMLDTGGTLVSTCRYLKDKKVKEIYIFVTHALFTGTYWKKLWDLHVKTIFCTDTMPTAARHQSKKIILLSVGQLLKDFLEQQAGHLPNGFVSGAGSIGTDTEEVGSTEEKAAVYPAPERKHLGVDTNKGTNPIETDQGDEQYEGVLYGTPDDVSSPAFGDEAEDRFIDKSYIR